MAQKVTFTLSENIVSNATSGVLVGDFNNWNPEQGVELKKQKDGSMKTTLALEAGKTYQYRYLLNDGRWVNDSNADAYAYAHEFFIDNCVITVPEEVTKPTKAIKAKSEVVTPVVEVLAKPVAKKVVTVKKVIAPATPIVEENKVIKAKKEVVAPPVIEEAAVKTKKVATSVTKTVKAKK